MYNCFYGEIRIKYVQYRFQQQQNQSNVIAVLVLIRRWYLECGNWSTSCVKYLYHLNMGKMFSLWMETILVGNVVHSVCNIGNWIDKGEAAANCQMLSIRSTIDYFCRFLFGLSVGKLVTVVITAKTDIIRRSFFHDDCFLIFLQRNCYSNSDEGGKSNDLREIKVHLLIK